MNISVRNLLIASLFGYLLSINLVSAEAPHRNIQSGDLVIEETKEDKKSPMAAGEKRAIAWVEEIQNGLKSGSAPGSLDELAMMHLSATYLYCISKAGQCGFILDTILESDVETARTSKTNQCPNMTKFWKYWVANEMEERAKYLMPIGLLNTITIFNRNERPRYIKCADTVATAAQMNVAERYAEGSTISKAISKTLTLLRELQSKGINVMVATDMASQDDVKKKK